MTKEEEIKKRKAGWIIGFQCIFNETDEETSVFCLCVYLLTCHIYIFLFSAGLISGLFFSHRPARQFPRMPPQEIPK